MDPTEELDRERAETARLRAEIDRLRADNAALSAEIEERRRLLSLLEDSLDGIWDWNILTGDDYLSPRWKRMLGYEPEELPDTVDTWVKLLHPDDVAVGYAAVQAHWETGAPYEVVLRYFRKDGALAWMLARGKAIRDDSGTWVRMAGSHTDLTQLKRTEDELRRSQTRYRNMFQGAGIPLIEADLSAVCARLDAVELPAGEDLRGYLAARPAEMAEIAARAQMLDINRAALELFGVASLGQLAERIEPLWQQMRPQRLADALGAIAERRPYFKAEMEVAAADDRQRSVIVTLTVEEGVEQVHGRLGLLDITERKLAEQKIRNLNAELEVRVAQRTSELATANSELESFAYTVSHDLRAPLRAIEGFSRLLQDTHAARLDGMALNYLERIQANSRRMSHLIEDLLGLSRVIRLAVQKQPLDLTAMVRDIVKDIREREPGRSVEVTVQEGMKVHADPGLFPIAMSNMLENAWKFTRNREVARIEVGRREDDGAYYVRDNGAGFEMKYADKLFGPFQRLHQEREFPGNGIGLATVERIIRRHGGRVWGTGEVGVGATFYFQMEDGLG